MMSCTVSAARSHHISSLCHIEHGQHRGAFLSDRITTVAMSRSGQVGLRCTVEPNCSGMSARLVGASVTRDGALNTCEPSCMPGAARPFFIPMVHNPLGPWGTWQHRSSHLGEARPGPCGSTGAHLGREARSGAEEYVAVSELSSEGGRAQNHQTRGSVEAHLDRKARSKAEEYVTVPELNSARSRGPGPQATGHVAASELTSARR
jgi:hypothetical protein